MKDLRTTLAKVGTFGHATEDGAKRRPQCREGRVLKDGHLLIHDRLIRQCSVESAVVDCAGAARAWAAAGGSAASVAAPVAMVADGVGQRIRVGPGEGQPELQVARVGGGGSVGHVVAPFWSPGAVGGVSYRRRAVTPSVPPEARPQGTGEKFLAGSPRSRFAGGQEVLVRMPLRVRGGAARSGRPGGQQSRPRWDRPVAWPAPALRRRSSVSRRR